MAHTAFHWQDPFLLDQQLNEDERMVQGATAAYCQDKLQPRVVQAFRQEQTDVEILVLHQFHCDFSLTARQSSFSKLSRTV
jgi:hypothetical protein